MAKLKKSAPWQTFYAEINEMFKRDDGVNVIFDEEEMDISLYVEDAAKAEALDEMLPDTKEFGNVKVNVRVIPANGLLGFRKSFDVRDAFDGNRAVNYIESTPLTPMSFGATYVVFKKEVVQYFDDSLSDVNGLCSTLYQDIANRIFENHNGIYFCTDNCDAF